MCGILTVCLPTKRGAGADSVSTPSSAACGKVNTEIVNPCNPLSENRSDRFESRPQIYEQRRLQLSCGTAWCLCVAIRRICTAAGGRGRYSFGAVQIRSPFRRGAEGMPPFPHTTPLGSAHSIMPTVVVQRPEPIPQMPRSTDTSPLILREADSARRLISKRFRVGCDMLARCWMNFSIEVRGLSDSAHTGILLRARLYIASVILKTHARSACRGS